MISNAVSPERVASVVGYNFTAGDFRTTSPNLPQRIAILAEGNVANQATMPIDPVDITSAAQAGALFGYGSPVHRIMSILRPYNSDGVGGIPTVVYAQLEAGSSAARVQTITVTGTATSSGTHYVRVAGRTSVDGSVYAVNIANGDTPTIIAGKIKDAIQSVLGSPITATNALGVVTATTKWKGLTSQSVSIEMDTNSINAGVTYAIAQTTAGSGTPDISASLNKFGSAWNTIVVSGYGTESTVLNALESYNGVPNPSAPTGRYQGIVMKPFIALIGSIDENPSSITDTRKSQVTIAVCPAPFSKAQPLEGAANMALLFARVSQDTPHLDVQDLYYNDMPGPTLIGAMADYNERDAIVKKGCSTVDLSNESYQVKDLTTYHPEGELPPQYRYCRNLMIDFNIRYGYYLLEQMHVKGHAIAGDNDIVTASKVIKPKQWKAILKSYAEDLGKRGLIADVSFMQNNIQVGLSTTNPDRLETSFKYKRTGYGRILSTTAQAGFNFGTN